MEKSRPQAKDVSSSGTKSPDSPTNAREESPELLRFSPEEEATLLQESHSIKAEANALFSAKNYDSALARYHDSVASCPKYLRYEHAVLQSNIAACHIKLEQWKDAIKTASNAIDGLLEYENQAVEPSAGGSSAGGSSTGPSDLTCATTPNDSSLKEPADTREHAASDAIVEEIVSPGAARSAPPQAQSATDKRNVDVARIRIKALLRRARARSETGGWQNLAGAEEDYRTLNTMPGLGPADMRTVRTQLRSLPPRTKAAQEAETTEMWGKLRKLGDGILKPFGLSTNNFQMVKDENTGGYSVNFSQKPGGGASSS